MNKIILDIDGVILDFGKALNKYLWETQKKYISLDPYSWDFNGKVDINEIIEFFKSDNIKYIEPFDGIVDIILNLKRQDDIVFLTSIPDNAEENRKYNLKQLGLNYPIYISNNKLEFVKENNWSVYVVIDDKPETILDFIDAGIDCIAPVKE
jgi:beta-phosphoglucomutase-like phosphatase (HAD superfamily)